MDMTVGSTRHDMADHRNEAIPFERAASARKVESGKTVAKPAACGDGWYHDDAIAAAKQDAIEARSNPYHH